MLHKSTMFSTHSMIPTVDKAISTTHSSNGVEANTITKMVVATGATTTEISTGDHSRIAKKQKP